MTHAARPVIADGARAKPALLMVGAAESAPLVAGAELDVVGPRLLQAHGTDEVQRDRVGLPGDRELAALPLQDLGRVHRRSRPTADCAGVGGH
jgi:hypothetical protein